MVNDAIRYLTLKYFVREKSYTVPGGSVAQTQFYNLPPQVEKVINVTVNIGNTLWKPDECPSRSFWDSLNVIPNLYQDYPSYFFIYNGQIGIFPTPSSNGNAITVNYKTRIQDVSMPDVTGTTSGNTLTLTSGTTTITASGTTFSLWMANNGWMRMTHDATNSKNGDNQWYQVASVTSGTLAFLANQYGGATVSGTNFVVGDVSSLPEDFQDLPLYRMGYVYYTTRFPDKVKAALYQGLWDQGTGRLDDEFSAKTTQVGIVDTTTSLNNPNLYQRNIG